jgi:hypothetical protein
LYFHQWELSILLQQFLKLQQLFLLLLVFFHQAIQATHWNALANLHQDSRIVHSEHPGEAICDRQISGGAEDIAEMDSSKLAWEVKSLGSPRRQAPDGH